MLTSKLCLPIAATQLQCLIALSIRANMSKLHPIKARLYFHSEAEVVSNNSTERTPAETVIIFTVKFSLFIQKHKSCSRRSLTLKSCRLKICCSCCFIQTAKPVETSVMTLTIKFSQQFLSVSTLHLSLNHCLHYKISFKGFLK